MKALATTFCVSWLLLPTSGTALAEEIVWGCDDAGYTGETTEYRHAVLGDDIEYKTLVLKVPTGVGTIDATLDLPEGQVFEDIAPRCGDLTGDGNNEVVTVISDAVGGARLAIFSPRTGPVAETPPIGQGFRWLAPIGIADLNGDGINDISYVETPHLGGTLRVWSLIDGKLTQIAAGQRFSNHRIGEDFITGGTRDCDEGVELVVPDFGWTQLLAVRFEEDTLVQRSISDRTDAETVKAALDCELK